MAKRSRKQKRKTTIELANSEKGSNIESMDDTTRTRTRTALLTRLSRTLLVVLACCFVACTPIIAVCSNADEAAAVDAITKGSGDSYGGSTGYVNEFMSGDQSSTGGWNENLLQTFGGGSQYQGDNAANGFVVALDAFEKAIAAALIGFVIIMTVVRFVGRGVYEIAFTSGKTRDTNMPKFFLTGEERGGTKNKGYDVGKQNWFVPMFRESLKYIGIAFFVWVVLAIIAGIVMFALTNITQSAPSDVTSFRAGDISVDTR